MRPRAQTRGRARRYALCLILATTLPTAVGVAVPTRASAAEPSATEKSTARRLLFEGRAKRRAGDQQGALQAFRAADAIMGVPTTALDLARTELELGLLVEASESLRRAVRWRGASPVPEPFQKAQREAEALLTELTPRVPMLRIVLRGDAAAASRLTVRLDGRVVPRAALAPPYAVNPGAHVLTLVADEKVVAERHVEIAERGSLDVELTTPAEAAVTAPSHPVTPADEPRTAPHAPTEPTRRDDEPPARPAGASVALAGGLVVAGAGLVVGATSGLVSLAKAGSAREQCLNGECRPEVYSTLDDASTAATVSDVAFVTAGVALAIAVVGWLWPRAPSAGTTATRARPAARGPTIAIDRPLFGGSVRW